MTLEVDTFATYFLFSCTFFTVFPDNVAVLYHFSVQAFFMFSQLAGVCTYNEEV